MRNEHDKLKVAYKAGKKAALTGIKTNPYLEQPKAKSYCERNEWFRGWLAGEKEKCTMKT